MFDLDIVGYFAYGTRHTTRLRDQLDHTLLVQVPICTVAIATRRHNVTHTHKTHAFVCVLCASVEWVWCHFNSEAVTLHLCVIFEPAFLYHIHTLAPTRRFGDRETVKPLLLSPRRHDNLATWGGTVLLHTSRCDHHTRLFVLHDPIARVAAACLAVLDRGLQIAPRQLSLVDALARVKGRLERDGRSGDRGRRHRAVHGGTGEPA